MIENALGAPAETFTDTRRRRGPADCVKGAVGDGSNASFVVRHSVAPSLASTFLKVDDEAIEAFPQREIKAHSERLAFLQIDCSADVESNELRMVSNSDELSLEHASVGRHEESRWERQDDEDRSDGVVPDAS
jgi:hypothetical protein